MNGAITFITEVSNGIKVSDMLEQLDSNGGAMPNGSHFFKKILRFRKDFVRSIF